MERKGTPFALSGAAILAVLFSPFAMRSQPANSSSSSPANVQRASEPANVDSAKNENAENLLGDETGPWFALCREFAQRHEHHDLSARHSGHPKRARVDQQPSEHAIKRNGFDEGHVLREHPVMGLSTCVPSGSELQFLIATVPDPDASHLSLDFDRYVEAIQHAAGLQSFDYERYWLPWQARAGKRAAQDSSAGNARRDEPGLMIFRRRRNLSTPDRWLLVFLVGETPTSGVNRIAFSRALDYIRELDSFARPERRDQVDIAGPNFSASYSSLADSLLSDRNPLPRAKFNIINPNSTAQTLIESFRQTLAGKLSYSYSAYELRTCRALQEWQRTMISLGYDPGELAVITEDESAYGTETANDAQRTPEAAEGTVPGASERTTSAECTPLVNEKYLGGEHWRDVPQLQFPRDLSSLRNAAEAQPQPAQPAELKDLNLPQLGIPLPLHQDTSTQRDSPPSFASDQSPARIDRALQEMVRRLRQLRTQAVMVTATNPLDMIFLLDYLRRSLPDLRFATFGADEFMLGRPKLVDFSGTLVISGLPLLSDHNVLLQRPGKNDLRSSVEFPSTGAESMFLAVSNLIAGKPASADSGNTNCATVTVVGKNGFRRLASDGPQSFPCSGPHSASVVPVTMPLPWTWSVALIGLAVLTLYHLAALAGARNRIPATYLRPPLPYVCLSTSDVCDLKSFFLFILNNQLFLMEWLVVTTTGAMAMSNGAFEIRKYQWVLFALHGLLLIATALTSASLLRCLVRKIRAGKAVQELRSRAGRFNLTICVVYVVWTMVTWWMMLARGWHLRLDAASAIRSAHFAEGLSPLATMAIILFAYGLWALHNLFRLTMMEFRRVTVALPENSVVARLQDSLQKSINESIYEVPLRLFGAGAVCLCLFRVWYVLRGIDHPVFRLWLVIWGFVSLLFSILVAFDRTWTVWRDLKKVLQYLDASPLRGAFAHVPRELSTMQIWRVGGNRVSFLLQIRTLELLERMQARSVASMQQKPPLALAMAQTGTDAIVGPRAAITGNVCESPKFQPKIVETRKCLRGIIEGHQAGKLPNTEEIRKLSAGLNDRMNDAATFFDHESSSATNYSIDERSRLRLYACYRFVSLIRYSMLQLRNMLTFVVYGYAALLLCVTVYPFQGRRSLGSLMTFVFLLLLSGITILLIQINRDPVLRRLDPPTSSLGESMGLLSKVLSIGGVPLLAILASQFPAIAEFLISWIRPAIEAAR